MKLVLERLINPGYRVFVVDAKNFQPEEITEGLRRRGAMVVEILGESDPELEIESFLSSTYGEYVYLLKFKDGRYLARSPDEVVEKNWSSSRYLVRDENALKRFLLRELSLKSRLALELPPKIITAFIWVLAFQLIEEKPFGSFLLMALGFVTGELFKLFEYLTLGYCRE
ncbi:MAG: hypothetical protein PWQ79_381 [Thermococcaceae archaeon]|nr:hypothetical protein [Thermococcaceae archaeon]MDK2913466.1 hypothetical protein [Thermococcaceae archaeon]